MPLNMETESTVLTRSAHSTPSDGDGRLERPIFFINADSNTNLEQQIVSESRRINKHGKSEPN